MNAAWINTYLALAGASLLSSLWLIAKISSMNNPTVSLSAIWCIGLSSTIQSICLMASMISYLFNSDDLYLMFGLLSDMTFSMAIFWTLGLSYLSYKMITKANKEETYKAYQHCKRIITPLAFLLILGVFVGRLCTTEDSFSYSLV